MKHSYDTSNCTFTLYDIPSNLYWDPCDDIYCIPINHNIEVVRQDLYLKGELLQWSPHVDRIVFTFKEKPSRKNMKGFIEDLYRVITDIAHT